MPYGEEEEAQTTGYQGRLRIDMKPIDGTDEF